VPSRNVINNPKYHPTMERQTKESLRIKLNDRRNRFNWRERELASALESVLDEDEDESPEESNMRRTESSSEESAISIVKKLVIIEVVWWLRNPLSEGETEEGTRTWVVEKPSVLSEGETEKGTRTTM
jgi:hypothetical protein